jgi:peroxiredoxin
MFRAVFWSLLPYALTWMSDATLEKMKTHNVDLDAATGNSNHVLAHPAVFVVSTNGVIRFVHVNPDFRVRLEPSKVL